MSRATTLYAVASWPAGGGLDWGAGQARITALGWLDLVETKSDPPWQHWVSWDEDMIAVLESYDDLTREERVAAAKERLSHDLDELKTLIEVDPLIDAELFQIGDRVVLISGGWPRDDDWPTTTCGQLSRLHACGALAAVGMDDPKGMWD